MAYSSNGSSDTSKEKIWYNIQILIKPKKVYCQTEIKWGRTIPVKHIIIEKKIHNIKIEFLKAFKVVNIKSPKTQTKRVR